MPRRRAEALDPVQAEELEALFSASELRKMAEQAAERMQQLLEAWLAAESEEERKEARHALKGLAASYGARQVTELVREPPDEEDIRKAIHAFVHACKLRWGGKDGPNGAF